MQERCSHFIAPISADWQNGCMTQGAVHRTARAIAREEITRAILQAGREQLAKTGPAGLSVRACARELGIASSAVYRYFKSRDELLTELIINGYQELGDAVRTADSEVRRRTDYTARWLAIARAARQWALDHPHDFGLIYGTPVPGYAAPRSTVEPATRAFRVLVELLAEAAGHGVAPEPVPVPRSLKASMPGLREFSDGELSDDLSVRATIAWSALIGTISLELFGHFTGVYDDLDAYFEHAIRRLAVV
jgi:AcrR family transcriptional regulator